MKLLFCDNTIWWLVNFREPVFRWFYEQGHEVFLVAPSDEGTEMKTSIPSYVKYVRVKLKRTSRNPLSDVLYMLRLRKIYRRERPDYIFHYTIKPNIYGSLAARSLGIRSSAMVAGLGYAFSRRGVMGAVVRGLYAAGLRCAERVFVLNEGNRATLLSHGICRSDKLLLLSGGEGVDLSRFAFSGDALCGHTVFLMVARVLYDKGYAEFVEAARHIRAAGSDAEFWLLGPVDESYPNAVPQAVIDADVRAGSIKYLGFSRNPQNIMKLPGVVVVVSSYHEGMNRSLMEACALGKPVITTDIPGCREMVDEGRNGFSVPPKDAEALAKAMEDYLQLTDEAKAAMGRAGRELAEKKYDIKLVIKEYAKILS